jgi:hypothetical protein
MMSDRSVTWSWAAAVEDANDDTRAEKTTAARHMRLTILHALLLVLAAASRAGAQPAAPASDGTPFARGRWHFEFGGQAALEAWNYNANHEGSTASPDSPPPRTAQRPRARMNQRFIYISQRSRDGALPDGAACAGSRRGRATVFLGDLSVSAAAIAIPARGTRSTISRSAAAA